MTTSNSHFFSELGQRIIKIASQFGPHGRLYEVDPRLRPTGRSGALAMPLDGFVRYFREGGGQLWERLALCKARVIVGSRDRRRARHGRGDGVDLQSPLATAGRRRRSAKCVAGSKNRPPSDNLKRGPGGTMDTEFIVEMLTLKHGREQPEVRLTGHARRPRGAAEAAGRLTRRRRGLSGPQLPVSTNAWSRESASWTPPAGTSSPTSRASW